MNNLDELQRIAEAATPGEWSHLKFGCVVGGPAIKLANGSAREQIAAFFATSSVSDEQRILNAEYVAAFNPSTCLALIADLRKAVEALEYYGKGDGRRFERLDESDDVERVPHETGYTCWTGKRARQCLSELKSTVGGG